MIKVFVVFLLFISTHALNLKKPNLVYESNGGVTSLVFKKNKLYVGTDASAVEIFNIKEKKLIKTIKINKIFDFMGDEVDAKVYSIDVYNNKILITSQSEKGFRKIDLYDNNKLINIINIDKKMFVSKAKFIDDSHIIFSLLSNEMYLYNFKSKKIIWKIDVRDEHSIVNSSFSDFQLNENKSLVVVADESGDLKIVDIKKAKVIKILKGENLDKVFKVDFKNNKIITAGQDGKCVIYDLKANKSYFLKEKKWFLIYGAALSPSATLGVYSSDEENNVIIFNTKTKEKLFKLTKNIMTISSILFINENEVFISSDSNKFNYYKLNNK